MNRGFYERTGPAFCVPKFSLDAARRVYCGQSVTHINLQLAKITTLGERVEDTFLIDGSVLQQNKLQIQVETELLDAITP